jgi:hypothetical protein
VTPLRLSGPADIVAAVPRLCGFTPSDSLVALVLGERRLLLTCRVDLEAGGRDLPALLDRLSGVDGAERVVWVLYESDLLAHSDLAERLAGSPVLRAEDVVSVADDRWADYLCQASCCPPEGTPIQDSGEVVAELVALGLTAASSRQERAALVAYDRPLDDTHAAIAEALQDVTVRDGLLAGQQGDLLDDLCAIMRGLLDDDYRLPRVAGATAALAYLQGDGALANLAIDRAQGDSLALLIDGAIKAAMPPKALREVFAAAVTA